MNNQLNPFQIKTPEKLPSEEVIKLFVDVFTDYEKIKTEGHTFILGPRGIGKSMIFRYIQPDCQCLTQKGDVSSINFLGVYIPLRNASFTTLTELRRLSNNAYQIINEHIMSVYCLQMIFKTLSDRSLYIDNEEWNKQARVYYNSICDDYFSKEDYKDCDGLRINEVFSELTTLMESYYRNAINYSKKMAFTQDVYPYKGPLFDYLGVVVPMVSRLHDIACFANKKVYFLIDDAHCLTDLQTLILNYWVSTRTSGVISIKISTQYNYKNYYTITGATIDSPHDYSEIDMFKVYTSQIKDTYASRMTEIVEKRLHNAGIDRSSKEFFPPDEKQENSIRLIEEEYKKRFDKGEGRGTRRSDDSIRYARPDYIKSLSGPSKSGSTYSYSGFEQLIHLSSGIARFFLESAYRMFAEELSVNENRHIDHISPSVQNKIVRDDANQFLFKELPKYAVKTNTVENVANQSYPEEDIEKLANLINGLGGLFRAILVSERSERRVFSIAFSDTPSSETKRILQLGVQLSYFHKSTIGKKESVSGGRTELYILNRRLAPIWNLDPTSFAGYLFVQNKIIEEAMDNPDKLLRRLKKDLQDDDPNNGDIVQLSFFNEEDDQLFSIRSGDEDE